MRKKISIIVPSLNQGKYLGETLHSIASQGYSNLELIVIDGGSIDRSVAVIETFAHQITYWESHPDRGQAHAINKGFSRATGDIVGWINSDDQLLPGSLQALEGAFVEGVQLVLGGVVVHSDLTGEETTILPSGVTLENMVRIWQGSKMSWGQPGTFLSRRLLAKIGPLDETLRYVFDREWMCRILMEDAPQYLGKNVAKFRLHSQSKTVKESRSWYEEQVQVTRRYLGHVPRLSMAEAEAELAVCWGALPCLDSSLGAVDRLSAVPWMVRSVRRYPLIVASRRFWLAISLILLPVRLNPGIRRFVERYRRLFTW